ncbi:hypothetical protein MAPG_00399 [Magnaporthiopsis poae ATCC 64411]|uniref:Uncharacterized protein n=1 Tax=Magnaporthiopsis poae (strain ATCC 64411 / 73-15) TaxID=644358 RepID=A0A0C4DKW7_MAGP6|nr:hypothetical protein MAPG_00399 [Magnaporthiopsis poae ATCC 64411]
MRAVTAISFQFRAGTSIQWSPHTVCYAQIPNALDRRTASIRNPHRIGAGRPAPRPPLLSLCCLASRRSPGSMQEPCHSMSCHATLPYRSFSPCLPSCAPAVCMAIRLGAVTR